MPSCSHPDRVEARLIEVHLPVLGSFVTAQDLFESPGGLNAVRFPLPKPREAAPIQTAPKPETLGVGTVHGTLPKIVRLRPFLTHDHSSPFHSLSQELSKKFPHLAVDGIDFLPLPCILVASRIVVGSRNGSDNLLYKGWICGSREAHLAAATGTALSASHESRGCVLPWSWRCILTLDLCRPAR